MTMTLAIHEANEMVDELMAHSRIKEVAVGIAPQVASTIATVATGNPVVGGVAGVVVTACGKTVPEAVARGVLGVGTAVAMTVACTIATPFLLGFVVYEAGKSLLGLDNK